MEFMQHSSLFVCVWWGTGKVRPGHDVVLFLSHGGGSRECVDAAAHLVSRGVAVLAITSNSGTISPPPPPTHTHTQ